MTIIAAHRSADGETWLGSDTRVTSEGFIYPVRLEKWARMGRWALALTGSQAGQELAARHSAEIADCEDAPRVALLLHEAMGKADWERLDNKGGGALYATSGILVSADGLWLLSGNGCVDAPAWGFLASGGGEDFAYGAAFVGHRMEYPPHAIVRDAVRAAIEFRSDCGGDVVVERF